jgi:hypothetical protein
VCVAIKLRTIWIKNQTIIDVNFEKQISIEGKFWRDVLIKIPNNNQTFSY